jgi:alpha-beta hydrolase superfamily lysophospholipase
VPRLALGSILVALAFGAFPRGAAAASPVTLTTDDGVTLSATLYQPRVTPAPAVVLLHMLGRSAADWAPLAERLAERGLVALAVDLRGHGRSRGDTAGAYAGASGAPPGGDLSPMLRDVKAALAWLQARPELATGTVGLAGASLGASLAVLAAADEPSVRSVALLSPGLDYRGLRIEAAMRKYGARHALVVASREDAYAVRSAKALAGGPACQLHVLEDAGHGSLMLQRAHELGATLVDWFASTLL